MAMQSLSSTLVRDSKSRSSDWPAHSETRALARAVMLARPASSLIANASNVSPASRASPVPNTVHADGRWRRSVSPSIKPSWIKEKS